MMLARIHRRPTVSGELGFSAFATTVVVAGIGLLVMVLTPRILGYVDERKKSQATTDATIIADAILKFTKHTAHFPLYADGTKTTGEPDIELLRGPGNDPEDHPSAPWLVARNVGELEHHVIHNTPGRAKYPTTGYFPWKGPYLDTITADPWGNRYLVNIKNANPADTPAKVVWVLSAGPNGKIETDPNANADAGPTPGGDDIAVRVK